MKKFLQKFILSVAAFAGGASLAQVINPSPPSTATAGTGLSQAGSVISLNYAVPNSPFTGSLSASGLTSILPITGSINAGAFNYGTLSYLDTGLFASFATTLNDHANLTIQNQSNGAAAKAMLGIANDLGTATAHRAEFGMNSSGVSGANSFQIGSGAFLRSITGDLAIGTTTNNAIHFLTNGSATDAMSISGAGAITVNNPLSSNSTISATGQLSGASLNLGAGQITAGYTAPDTGAVNRGLYSKLNDTVTVTDFGVDNTGATDSCTGLTAAVNYVNSIALTSVPVQLMFPQGTYKSSCTLQFNRPVSIVSHEGATLNYTGNSSAIILGPSGITGANVYTQGEYTVDGLQITGGAAATYGIYINSYVIEPRIRNVVFNDFGNSASTAIFAQDHNWDTIIENCRYFITNVATATGGFIKINGVSTGAVPDGGNSRVTIRDTWATSYNGVEFSYFAYINATKSRVIGGGFQHSTQGIIAGPGASGLLVDGVYCEQGASNEAYITAQSSGTGSTLVYPQQVTVKNGYVNFHASNAYTGGTLVNAGDANVLYVNWLVSDMTIADYNNGQTLIVRNNTVGQTGNRYSRVTGIFIPPSTNNGNVFAIVNTAGLAGNWNNLDTTSGTWTPSVGGTATYTLQNGSYTIVGNVVTASFDIQINTIGTGSTSTISGLPFTVGSVAGSGSVGFFNTLSQNVLSLNLRADGGGNSINVTGLTAASASVPGTLAVIGSATRLTGTVTYIANF
ncbi:MAG: hypothetical protein KGL39_27545 [Patescibacteria group bacterium]|nr:hypothetical protein [Patescibacteria group bacterium]